MPGDEAEKEIKIAPSVLAADFLKLGEEIRNVEKAGAGMIHIDVMDGSFVPNISVGVPVVESIRKATRLDLDVHLMIQDPIKYIKAFAEAGADNITVHLEACEDIFQTINEIKKYGCRAGISIKPNTGASEVMPYLKDIGMVLVMTVEPGFGGQAYIEETTKKINEIYNYIKSENLPVDIQVDGGINSETIKTASSAGANVFVAGTAVFRAPDPEKVIKELIEAAVAAKQKEC